MSLSCFPVVRWLQVFPRYIVNLADDTWVLKWKRTVATYHFIKRLHFTKGLYHPFGADGEVCEMFEWQFNKYLTLWAVILYVKLSSHAKTIWSPLYGRFCWYVWWHTMHLPWENFQLILPLYMKPISFQWKTSVVCSVPTVIFIDFCFKKLNVFSQHIGKKKWISEFRRTNPQELKCWSTFCVSYFLRYYLMRQHQPIVKRVNGTHEWAHRLYQLLSAPYHGCLYKHMRQDER